MAARCASNTASRRASSGVGAALKTAVIGRVGVTVPGVDAAGPGAKADTADDSERATID